MPIRLHQGTVQGSIEKWLKVEPVVCLGEPVSGSKTANGLGVVRLMNGKCPIIGGCSIARAILEPIFGRAALTEWDFRTKTEVP